MASGQDNPYYSLLKNYSFFDPYIIASFAVTLAIHDSYKFGIRRNEVHYGFCRPKDLCHRKQGITFSYVVPNGFNGNYPSGLQKFK
jgi:hypothetical protein